MALSGFPWGALAGKVLRRYPFTRFKVDVKRYMEHLKKCSPPKEKVFPPEEKYSPPKEKYSPPKGNAAIRGERKRFHEPLARVRYKTPLKAAKEEVIYE
jgi:hypothetical protein